VVAAAGVVVVVEPLVDEVMVEVTSLPHFETPTSQPQPRHSN
jgi:hypothetical protein